jgi:uncharacterized iron-regulated membrane protein
LIAAIFVICLGVTGSIMAFQDDIVAPRACDSG